MQNRSKTTAGILALFLGGLGIHKFYLGQVGIGLLYLLFVWTGIPSVVGFIEGVIYLTVSEKQFTEMVSTRSAGGSIKFILIGLFGLFAAVLVTVFVAYTFITNTQSTTQDFYTVQELQAKGNRFVGKNLRLSGAVLGDTIQFDSQTLTLSFMVVNISREATDLDTAVNDPNAPRVRVIYIGPRPELLRHGVQVFVYGRLGKDGIFYADELLVNWKNTPY